MSNHPQQTVRQHYRQLFVFFLGAIIWFAPVPEGLTPQAWHHFDVFITANIAVIIKAMAIFTSSILVLAVVVLTGTLTAKQAYSEFSEDFILLIIVAFLIARGVIKSSLGFAYSVIAADMFISPAFPSNTVRSGVLYPIVNALGIDKGFPT